MTGTIGLTVSPVRAAVARVASVTDEHRDYYDPSWGRLVEGQGIDASGEPWERQLPLMRIYGFVVFGAALAVALPDVYHEPWRAGLAVAMVGALAVVFAIMWVRRAIWEYSTRTLAIHGIFQVAVYALLVSLSPGFAVLLLIVYPQVVFSLPTRWSVAGTLFVGTFTGLVMLARSPADPGAGLPWLLGNVLIALLVVAMGVWMRLTIAQSLERRALIAELTAARRELADAEREAAVSEERARVAREIHDTLAQGFASVVAHLEAADASLGADQERARRDFRAAEEVARSSLAEARTLVWALRPETIAAAGLPAAIKRVAGTGGPAPAVEVSISGEPRQLHPEVEVTILRAAQEAVANARRHASASRIDVTLTYFDDEVTLDVADDGRGFDPDGVRGSAGMGLLGMRERVERLGGSVAIESSPGEGTTIAVAMPAIEPPAPQPPAAPPAAHSPAGPLEASTAEGKR